MEEKMRLIKRNCLIIGIVGVILLIIGIAFLNSNSGSSWSGGWYSNIKKQQEQNQQIGGICLGISIVIFILDAIYYNHSKANLMNSNTSNINQNKINQRTDDDNVSKLRQLKEMCDDGIISKEEYEIKKKKILDNM